MRQNSGPLKARAETAVKDTRRLTRKQHSTGENTRLILEALGGEENIAELCQRGGIAMSLHYSCSTEFLKASKGRLV